MDVPSQHAVDVPLLPEEANATVVGYAESSRREFPSDLRKEFGDQLVNITRNNPAVIEVVDGSAYHGKKHQKVFKVIKFQPWVKAHEALKMARRWRSWFFQSLIPARDRRIERAVRRERQLTKHLCKRRTRHAGKYDAHIKRREVLCLN